MLPAMAAGAAAATLLAAAMRWAPTFGPPPAPPLPRVPWIETNPALAFDAESIDALRPAGSLVECAVRETVRLHLVPGARLPMVGDPPAAAGSLRAYLRMTQGAQREPRLAGLRLDSIADADGVVDVAFEPASPGAADALLEVLTPAIVERVEERVEATLRGVDAAFLDPLRAPDSPFAWTMRAVEEIAPGEGEVRVTLRRLPRSFAQALAFPGAAPIRSRLVLGLNAARQGLTSPEIRRQVLAVSAGMGRGGGPRPGLRVLVRQGTPEELRAREAAHRWGGVAVPLADEAFWTALKARDFDAFVGPLVVEGPFPAAAHLHSSQSRTGLNFFGYTSPECDALLERAERAADDARARALEAAAWRRAEADGVLRVLD